MFVDGAAMYMKEGIEDLQIFSMPPRRQLLFFSYYEALTFDRAVAEYEVPLPYSHYIIKKMLGRWYMHAVVWSLDCIDSVENVEKLPIIQPALPNFSFLTEDLLYEYREKRRGTDPIYPHEEYYLGSGCFNSGHYDTPIQCMNSFWAMPFNKDLSSNYTRHPFTCAIIPDVKIEFAKSADDFNRHALGTHETLSIDDMFKILKDNDMGTAELGDVDPRIRGTLDRVDLEAGYAA